MTTDTETDGQTLTGHDCTLPPPAVWDLRSTGYYAAYDGNS